MGKSENAKTSYRQSTPNCARYISSRLIFRPNEQTATRHVVSLQYLTSAFDGV